MSNVVSRKLGPARNVWEAAPLNEVRWVRLVVPESCACGRETKLWIPRMLRASCQSKAGNSWRVFKRNTIILQGESSPRVVSSNCLERIQISVAHQHKANRLVVYMAKISEDAPNPTLESELINGLSDANQTGRLMRKRQVWFKK